MDLPEPVSSPSVTWLGGKVAVLPDEAAPERETLPDPWLGWSDPYHVPSPRGPGAWKRHRIGPGGIPVEVCEVPAPEGQ